MIFEKSIDFSDKMIYNYKNQKGGVSTREEFIKCVIYLAVVGFSGFVFGLFLPRDLFSPNKFPFKSFSFENEGKIYEKFHIRKWKNKVPDMSKICKKMVPKTFDLSDDSDCLKKLIFETCVAEFIHSLQIVFGFCCKVIWAGPGGDIMAVIWLLGNLPFIIIQRYNRPKLMRTYKKMTKLECSGKGWLKHENVNTDM